MKKLKYIWTLYLVLLSIGFIACNEDDKYFDKDVQNSPITISKIYLEDAESTVPDREVTFARLGQIIRIEGSGLYGVKTVYINGYDTYFNRTYVSDKSMLVQLNSKIPVTDAEESVRNTIRLVQDGAETVYEFTIRAASPTISNIDNTLPQVGEKVIVYGNNLQETNKITLPGGIEVTDITSDEDGEWYSFIMPADVTESGSITSEGANGIAITPACFNNNDCYVINFDEKGVLGSWSATYSSTDLVDDPLNSGRGKVAMLIPQSRLDEGGVKAGERTLVWFTAGNDEPTDDWTRMTSFIPENTQASQIALQFDAYIPEAWGGTGQMEITLQNNLSNYGYGSVETTFTTSIDYPTAMVWVPWLVDGENVPYTTGDRWVTITIPLTKFGKYSDEGGSHTFAEVISDRNAGSYRNFGFLFCNSDLKYSEELTFEASNFNQKLYVDNFRIVPNANVTVSDYPDEESAE